MIATLIAAATGLIFVAVFHRYGAGLSIDFANGASARHPGAPGYSARHLLLARVPRHFLGAGTLHLHVHLDGEVRRRLWRAHRHPCRRRRAGQPAAAADAQARDPVRAPVRRAVHRAIATFGRSFVAQMFETGQQSNDLEAPMWFVYPAIPLGSGLMCFRFLQVAWWYYWTGELPHHNEARSRASPRRTICIRRPTRHGVVPAAGRRRWC